MTFARREEPIEIRYLVDAAAYHDVLRIECSKCDHQVAWEPYPLWWWFECKGWDQRLTAVPKRLYCKKCWQLVFRKFRPRPPYPVRADPDPCHLPMPLEREWKRVMSRYRR